MIKTLFKVGTFGVVGYGIGKILEGVSKTETVSFRSVNPLTPSDKDDLEAQLNMVADKFQLKMFRWKKNPR